MKKGLHIGLMMAITVTFWSLAYAGTSLFYQQVGLQTNDFFKGLLTLFVMIALSIAVMWTFAKFAPHRRNDFFTAIIDAMKRISKGDYTIRIVNQFEHKGNHPFSKSPF